MSGSTHIPPTGIHWPVGDLVGDAGEQLRLALGDPGVLLGLRAREAVVRARRPSAPPPRRTCACTCAPSRRSGHSHAVSMWAWPGGDDAVRRRAAPAARARRRAPPGAATAASSHPPAARASTSSAADDGDADPAPGGGRRGRACASRRRGRRGRGRSASASASTTTSSARSRRYSGRSPAVSGEPSGDGRNCGNIGFDAASTTQLDRARLAGAAATAWRRGWMPCTGRPLASRTRPSHWKPGESSRNPRSSSASTRRPDHAAGTSPVNRNHVVPHGGPQRSPTANGARSSSDGPASTVSGRRCGWTSGSTRSASSRVIRSSTSSRSSCIGPFWRPGGVTGSSQPAPSSRPGAAPSSGHGHRPHRRSRRRPRPRTAVRHVARCSPGAGCSALFAGAGVATLARGVRLGGDDSTRRRRHAPTGRPRTTATTTATTRGDAATTRRTSCAPIPEETAGPFPGDGSNGVNVLTESGVVRSDIRSSFGSSTTVAEGVPLTIELTVADTAAGCAPLARRGRLPLALRPRRQLLDVHRRRGRRELPARRAGDRRRRAG